MTTQSEMDAQYTQSGIERRLGEVERKTNALYSAGLELLVQSGYLQFDGVPFRWDTKGQQVETHGAQQIAIYFVDKLRSKPDNSEGYGYLLGDGDADASVNYSAGRARAGGFAINNSGAGGFAGYFATDYTVVGDDITSYWAGLYSVGNNGSQSGFIESVSTNSATNNRSKGTYFRLLPNGAEAQPLYIEGGTDPGTLLDGMVWYNTTDDKLYARINGATVELGGGGGMSLIVKEADETVNGSATEQADDELLFPVLANEVWQFEGMLFVAMTTTEDLKMRFSGPAGAVGSWGAISYSNSTTASAPISAAAALGTSDRVECVTSGVTIVQFWGAIHNGGTGGSCTLEWAQQTLTAVDTKVLAGSYIKFQKET